MQSRREEGSCEGQKARSDILIVVAVADKCAGSGQREMMSSHVLATNQHAPC